MKRPYSTLLTFFHGAVIVAAVSLGGLAQAAASTTDPAQSFTLSNGMTLIVKPDRRAPTVVHMLWVRVGSMDEVDGTSGVAHALEHMMFKGTPSLKPGEFSRRVAALGGRDNAFTSRDNTAYHQQVPTQHLEAVMRLEADRFAHNRWEDDEFKREIEVIKEERRQRTEESPRGRMFEAFNAMTYLASPYRRPVIGWMSDLDAMTPQDVRDFHQRWYVPGNAAVVIAGDVDVAQVRALAEKIYGGIAARPVPVRKPRLEPEQVGPRRMEYRAATEQALVALSYPVPGLRDPQAQDPASQDALALAVLSAVLDGYSGARMDRALVQGEKGPRVADSASASYGLLGRGPAQFSLTAVPAAGVSADVAAQALQAEVARIARDGISDTELRRVKTQWAAGEIYKLDSVFNQAQELGTYWVNGMDIQSGERLVAQLRAVTAEQVRSVAQRHFSDDRLSTAVLVPESHAPHARTARGPPPGLGKALKVTMLHTTLSARIQRVLLFAGVLAVALPAQAAIPIQHWTHASGARVYLVASPAIPMLDVQIDMDGGSLRDPAAQAGLASATASLMSAGVAAHQGQPALDENQLSEAWVDLGAQMGTQAGGDRFSVSLRSLTEPDLLERAVALAARQLAAPAWPDAVWQRDRQRWLASMKEAETRPGTHAGRAFSQAVYRDHPYGREVTATTVGAITVNDMRTFYRRHAAACRAQVSLVGAIDRATAERIVDRFMAALAPHGCEPLASVASVAPLKQAVEQRLPFDAAQAQVLLGQPGHRRDDPDFFPLFVGNYILGGGGFVSRLTTEVREKRGLSYSAYSYFAPGLHAGTFQIGLTTRPDQADKALGVARDVVQRFVDEGPTDAELQAAKDYLINGFALRIDSNRKLLDNVANIAWNGLPLDYLETWTSRVQAVSVADIRRAFTRVLQPDRMVTVVVGAKP